MNIIPALYPNAEASTKIPALLCDIQIKIDNLFCRELYFRKVGNKWQGLQDQGIGLLNAMYALQNNPDDDLVDVIECWFKDRYNK